jgi:hypothetical protein
LTKKGKLKLLGRVRVARQRLRDHAAGEYAVAEAAEIAADERRDHAEAGVDEVKDAAIEKLPEARTVRVLWTLEHEQDLARHQLREAETAARAARDESERQRQLLARRARELKTAEKVIDQTRKGLQRDESRAEQRSNDDMASRGRRDE